MPKLIFISPQNRAKGYIERNAVNSSQNAGHVLGHDMKLKGKWCRRWWTREQVVAEPHWTRFIQSLVSDEPRLKWVTGDSPRRGALLPNSCGLDREPIGELSHRKLYFQTQIMTRPRSHTCSVCWGPSVETGSRVTCSRGYMNLGKDL